MKRLKLPISCKRSKIAHNSRSISRMRLLNKERNSYPHWSTRRPSSAPPSTYRRSCSAIRRLGITCRTIAQSWGSGRNYMPWTKLLYFDFIYIPKFSQSCEHSYQIHLKEIIYSYQFILLFSLISFTHSLERSSLLIFLFKFEFKDIS